jgi:potassium/hydrogen antiporter
VTVAPEKAPMTLSDYFTEQFMRAPKEHDALRLGPMALVAHTVTDGKVTTVGLQLAEPEHEPRTLAEKMTANARQIWEWMRERFRP